MGRRPDAEKVPELKNQTLDGEIPFVVRLLEQEPGEKLRQQERAGVDEEGKEDLNFWISP